jgi:hypothetical protein
MSFKISANLKEEKDSVSGDFKERPWGHTSALNSHNRHRYSVLHSVLLVLPAGKGSKADFEFAVVGTGLTSTFVDVSNLGWSSMSRIRRQHVQNVCLVSRFLHPENEILQTYNQIYISECLHQG